MNYDDMPAGPELDRLIAEKVMGWRFDHQENAWYHGDLVMFAERLDDWGVLVRWSPSAEIAHAWMVVELIAMKPPRKAVRIHHCSDMAICRVIDFHSCDTIGEGNAATAPLAICRGVLKAVG